VAVCDSERSEIYQLRKRMIAKRENRAEDHEKSTEDRSKDVRSILKAVCSSGIGK